MHKMHTCQTMEQAIGIVGQKPENRRSYLLLPMKKMGKKPLKFSAVFHRRTIVTIRHGRKQVILPIHFSVYQMYFIKYNQKRPIGVRMILLKNEIKIHAVFYKTEQGNGTNEKAYMKFDQKLLMAM